MLWHSLGRHIDAGLATALTDLQKHGQCYMETVTLGQLTIKLSLVTAITADKQTQGFESTRALRAMPYTRLLRWPPGHSSHTDAYELCPAAKRKQAHLCASHAAAIAEGTRPAIREVALEHSWIERGHRRPIWLQGACMW